MVYMGHVTLRKVGFSWNMSHRGRDSLYEKCHNEEGRVYMGHVTLGKGGLFQRHFSLTWFGIVCFEMVPNTVILSKSDSQGSLT